MKRVLALLVCFALLSSFFGCRPATGEMIYSGIYVKAENGQHILICSTDDGEEYFLLQEAENCKSLDRLKTGDKITIKVICLAYEDVEFSERRLLDWSKDLFGHTNVSKASLQHIENLVAQYESP